MNQARSDQIALIYPVRKLDNWWRLMGQKMNYQASYTIGDLRGDCDFNVVDDFYKFQKQYYQTPVTPNELVTCSEIEDIIARCRLLRFLPYRLARSMVLGMAEAMNLVIEQVKPTVVISFPIDRYVSDVLRLLAAKRGVPHHEFTVGPLADTVMILNRGRLNVVDKPVCPKRLQKNIDDITNKYFEPSYVQKKSRFTKGNFCKTYFYFRLRGLVFKAISYLKRDPLNLHYLDAQSFLGHKPRLADRRVLDMVDNQWRSKLEACPQDTRVFLGLSVFPEAAIDYWIDDLKLIEYEDLMVNIATELSVSGFSVFIKDHPLQFGFRKANLLDRLLAIPNTVLVPYEVDGKQLISDTAVTVTVTGTIGLEAAMIGKKAIIVENYYSTPEDFIMVDSYDVKGLGQRVIDFPPPENLQQRQTRIISRLMKGSFDADYFAYLEYYEQQKTDSSDEFSRQAKAHLDLITEQAQREYFSRES